MALHFSIRQNSFIFFFSFILLSNHPLPPPPVPPVESDRSFLRRAARIVVLFAPRFQQSYFSCLSFLRSSCCAVKARPVARPFKLACQLVRFFFSISGSPTLSPFDDYWRKTAPICIRQSRDMTRSLLISALSSSVASLTFRPGESNCFKLPYSPYVSPLFSGPDLATPISFCSSSYCSQGDGYL